MTKRKKASKKKLLLPHLAPKSYSSQSAVSCLPWEASALQKKDTRPTWDEYFMGIAHLISKRSTCLRRRVGAVVVKDKRVLATGYNGAPTGIRHCSETGCLREELKIPSGQRHELCRGLHAEQNAIIQAALHGVSLKGSVLYITNQPCIICAKMLINAGIDELIFQGVYPDRLASDFLKEAKIKIRIFKEGDKR